MSEAYKCSILIFCFLGFLFNEMSAQVIRENEHGEKIIVMPDGSWEYFSGEGGGSFDDATLENTPTSYPIYDGTIAPLEGYISVTSDDLYNMSVRKSQLATEALNIAMERRDKATSTRDLLEKEYAQLQSNANATPEAIKLMGLRLLNARKNADDAQIELNEAERLANEAELLTTKGEYVSTYLMDQESKKRQKLVSEKRYEMVGRSYRDLLPMADVSEKIYANTIMSPPQKECVIAYEGLDEKTGQYRVDTRQEFLFSFTDDKIRPFLKDKDYMRCEGYFTALGGYRYLTLEFTFAYPNAREAYGFIDKGSVLTIKMMDDTFVNLFAGEMDRGSYDLETELLTYKVHYPIDRSQIQLLKNKEADALRVFWSSGYEEYPLYHLDFFKHQINCIE